MIKIENLILQGSDKFINFNSSNVNFLDVSNNDIFDILSFNTSKIISGNIFVNDERLGIYKSDDFYIYILKIKDKEISFSVVFNLKYEIANKTISNFKKQLRLLKEKHSKNNNHNEKIIDLINLINNSDAKYVLCDLNEAKNNNYISIFKEIDFNDKIDFIFKSFNPNLIQKENPINQEIKDNGFKTILKRNYSYLIFLSLFSIFTSFCSFSSIYVIDNNNLLLGVFLTIISAIFFLLPFSIFDIFYKELISLKYSKKVKFCTFLIEFCAVLVGFSIGIGIILLLSNYNIFISLDNYQIIESLLTIIFGSILLISPFISFVIFKIMSYIKIGFDKIKNRLLTKEKKTKNKLDILWLGHSCFLLDDGHIKICIDPYKDGSVPNLKLPSVSCNYVFKSHNHDDHNFLEGVMVTLNKVEDPNVEIISSYHDDQKGALRGKNDIHIFYLGGYKIVHFGDIGCSLDDLEMEKLKNSDLFLMPINGYYTIGSDKAYQMFKILKPKIMIPMHYFYHNSGYKDDNQISKLINLSKADIIYCRNKNIHLEDYLNNDTSKILILDSNNL